MIVHRLVKFIPETLEESNILKLIQTVRWRADNSTNFGVYESEN